MARKMYDEDVELNEFHCNKKLQGHILSSREMKKAGFRELEDRWFYSRMLDKKADISFDVSIYKDNPTERVNIEVFDEDYGQHYDFQKYLNKPERLLINGTEKITKFKTRDISKKDKKALMEILKILPPEVESCIFTRWFEFPHGR